MLTARHGNAPKLADKRFEPAARVLPAVFWGKLMAISGNDAHSVQGAPLRPVTLAWVLKRSLVGIAILLVAMGGLAWLTYASIDPALDSDLEPKSAKSHHSVTTPNAAIDL
jgi:hypothetical protein